MKSYTVLIVRRGRIEDFEVFASDEGDARRQAAEYGKVHRVSAKSNEPEPEDYLGEDIGDDYGFEFGVVNDREVDY